MNIKNKRLLSLLTAGMMMGAMAVPAAAADITINGGAQGSEYSAFRLLDLTTSLKKDHADHAEGEGHDKDCYNYAYTVNAPYRAALQAAVGEAADKDADGIISDEEIIAAIGAMDADAVRTFADTVFEAVKAGTPDITATGNTFAGAAQGYYLITETKAGAAPDSISLVMLDTAGQDDISVQSKEGVPTLQKKIMVGEALVDADSVAIGDTVKYQLKATMPDKINDYETYKMVFHDKIGDGLSLKAGSVKVTVDGTEYANFVLNDAIEDGCGLEVVIADLKNGAAVDKDSVVLVEYECTVAADAAIGSAGNENAASLEFTNNPYNTAEGTSETLEDKVKVFTFQVKVNKVDKDNAPLAGAGFTLFKKGADGQYSDTGIESGAAEGETEFVFSGLDEGDYKLVETTVPDGYTKADDVEFTIEATMDLDSADPQLTDLTAGENFTLTSLTSGEVVTNVVNVAGFRLPITGGQGTYAIYAGGALLLVAAGAAVVVKKRKADADAE